MQATLPIAGSQFAAWPSQWPVERLNSLPDSMGMVDHPNYGRVRYTAVELSTDPDEQVAQTISLMGDMVAADAQTPQVGAELAAALAGNPALSPCEAVWAHIKGRLRFQRDEVTGLTVPHGHRDGVVVETLVRPADMAMGTGVAQQVGDCDDFTMLTACLLERAGIKWKFATIAADPESPDTFSHVYVVAYPDGGVRVPLDTSHGPVCGWEHPAPFRRQEWSGKGGWLGTLAWASVLTAGTLWALNVWRGRGV